MKAKKLFCMITILALLLSLTTTAFATYSYEENISPPADNVSQIIGDGNTVVFIDIPSNYWARDQIDYFAQQGIIDGYTDGSFKPEAGVTREEFCKLLVSTFKQPLETPNTPTFADVPENRWSYPYVEVCRDFLTGYANPFGGAPSFHPTEYATREDIAVALVRMMGFTDSDANNPNYAAYNFRDGGSISPNLLAYVSIACERGLISGYPDGTFGPTKGITRAETVVLLNRATKQAVTNIKAELEMTANVLYSEDGKTATINIIAEEGTTVTVNGETVKMSSNYYDEYEGNFVYKFEKEGSKDFVIEGKRAGKTKSIRLIGEYKVDAPNLTITSCPTISNVNSIEISGVASNTNEERPVVTVNGKSVYVSYDGQWSTSVALAEGKNTIEIIATNTYGKSATVTRTVEFGVSAPKLTITSCPTTSKEDSVEISGVVSDANDERPVVTVDGKSVYVSYDGKWNTTINLTEGLNTIEIIATNTLGKSTVLTKSIEFGVSAPKLTITSCPTTSKEDSVEISGVVSDTNDERPVVTVDGKSVYVSYDGKWNTKVSLYEGRNTIEIIATNTYGKSTSIKKIITYSSTNSVEDGNDGSDGWYNNSHSTNNDTDSYTSSDNKDYSSSSTSTEENIDNASTVDYDYDRKCNYCNHNDGTITLTLKIGVKTDIKWDCSSCGRENWNYITYRN